MNSVASSSEIVLPQRSAKLSRGWRIGLASLMILAVLFLASDFLVRKVAENKVANLVSAKLGAEAEVKVKIDDWPILFSLAAGQVDDLQAEISNVKLNYKSHLIKIEKINLVASHISDVATPSQAVIEAAKVDLLFSWDTLTAATANTDTPAKDLKVTSVGNGRIRVSFITELMGAELPVNIEGEPWYDKQTNRIKIANPTVNMDRVSVPGELVNELVEYASRQINLPNIDGIDYRSFSATDEGGLVQVELRNFPVSNLSMG